MKLKAIIVDDEDLARKNLSMLLTEYCPTVEVIGDAGQYFRPEDEQEMSRCILDYLADETLKDRLSGIALERAGSYTWERAAEMAETSFRRSLTRP